MSDEDLHHKRYERNKQIVAQLRLIDDDFMKVVFKNSIPAVQKTLQIIMEKPDLIVDSVQTEDDFHSLRGRSVRLDVHAKDSAGIHYDVEIQRADKGAGQKRARYNQSLLDSSLLDRGELHDNLPDVYIIFITERDFFGGGFPLYHVERIIKETDELFNDGEHIIYANGAYFGDDDVGKPMSDFRARRPEDINFSELADPVRYYKEDKEGVENMCRTIENLCNERAAETRAKDIAKMAKSVCALMRNLEISMSAAMKILEISPEDRKEIEEAIEKI